MTLSDAARGKTALRGEHLDHLQRLVASWQILADLCFSDLLLLVPVDGEEGRRFVVVAQVRPTTGQTLYPMDLVGSVVDEVSRPLVSRAWRRGEIVEGDAPVLGSRQRARVQCVPVRWGDELLGVVTRDARATLGRQLGELEDYYLDAFSRFAAMVADGTFPFPDDGVDLEGTPRVGDGTILLERDLRVRFASPNAVSAMHRMGIYSYASGLRLADLGFEQRAAEEALRNCLPATEEIERGEVSLLVRVIPFLEQADPVGALLLVRDVTDLRRRDRMLVSKDATIREIHHRVKNNLQTIAALLRLQGRRTPSLEAQAAIEESERRIRAIAIVHETLSRDAGDAVAFNDVIGPLVRVVEESVAAPGADLRFDVLGDAGTLPGDVATPLAVVINELMQNAVDHAFRDSGAGRVTIHLERQGGELAVDVVDDGAGLPDGFSIEHSSGLGLSIVHALVTGELGGSIRFDDVGGTRVHLEIPLRRHSSTA